jgi:DEAD/DEAH box helicase domain-containing protein
VLSSSPLDQFVAADPGFLWGQPPEHARVDADNPEILLPHLRCAVHELAYEVRPKAVEEGPSAPADLVPALEYLAQCGAVHREEDPDPEFPDGPPVVRYLPVGADSPAEGVDLRGSIEENFSVVDDATGDILAEVDFEDAPLYVHPGAIYTIEGRTHEVRRLDWDERKAYVRRVGADYYTEAICKLRVRIVDPDAGPDGQEGSGRDDEPAGTGFAHVVRSVPGFKKIRFGTHENIGFGPIELPDLELHTVAVFWRFPQRVAESMTDPVRRCAAVLAAAHALHHVAAMVLMCDAADLGSVVTAGHPSSFGQVMLPNRRPSADMILAAGAIPYIVLYDRQPGGAGLAAAASGLGPALVRRAVSVVVGCGCERGCPTCMGPSSDDAWESDRGDVVAVLEGIAAGLEPSR